MKELQGNLERIIADAGGEWGIVVEDLNTNKRLTINADDQFAAQSIIKVPIMVALFTAYEEKKINLDELLSLKRADIVQGAGNLQFLTSGIQLPVYDLITLMIIQSDNTATNLLIDLIGLKEINRVMEYLGMEKSCLRKKLMIYPVTENDCENYSTASDIALLLRKMATGKIISRNSSAHMIKILKQQQIRNGLPAYLPESNNEIIGVLPKWELANKTGWDTEYQHDVGILYVGQRSVTISALSQKVDATKSLHALAKIGQEVYKYVQA